MILAKLATTEELAEALYYAHVSASIVVSDHPHAAPNHVDWEDLDATARDLWSHTARRLIALHG